MVSSKKAKQALSKGLSQRLKEDRISQLPDPLICQILSYLPTKDSVKTSVLSTRWKTLWLWAPSFEIIFGFPDYGDFPDFSTFVSFGNRFFDTTRVSRLQKLKLRIDESEEDFDDAPCFTSWIDAAVERKVQHLDVLFPADSYSITNQIPISIYICETLVSLKFHEVVLPNAEFVSLPCLKIMRLLYVHYPNAATFERLVSCCPVLEVLKIDGVGINRSVMRVHSLSLKSLKIRMHDNRYGVVIDAPLLRRLKIDDLDTESYIIKNMGSNAKLDIYLDFGLQEDFDEARVLSRRSIIRNFFSGISKARDMKIYRNLLELICQYSKLESLPQFSNMSRLYADIHVPDWKCLLPFLGSCPNLKSLSLYWEGDAEMDEMTLSYVPECLISSLKYVDIKSSVSGYDVEMKLVRYFLENSVNLKKLTLSLNYRKNAFVIFKKLLKIPRRSITCQVVVR